MLLLITIQVSLKRLKKKGGEALKIHKCEENTFCFVNCPVTLLGCDWGCSRHSCPCSQGCHCYMKGWGGKATLAGEPLSTCKQQI